MDAKFKNSDHKNLFYYCLCELEKRNQNYQNYGFFYLLSLACESVNQIQECFDFNQRIIKSTVLRKAWITSGSKQALKLAFSIWNSSQKIDIAEAFTCGYGEYFIEALKLEYSR